MPRPHLVSLALWALLPFALHCAAGEEFDFGTLHDGGGIQKITSKTGSGGSLAAGGSAGDFTGSGASGEGGSQADDASSTGGQGGGTGGTPVTGTDSGTAGSVADATPYYDVAPCPTCALSVQYSLQKLGDSTNEIGFNLAIKNTGNQPVTINQIAVRYWYTINGEATQVSAIDYSNPSTAAIQFVKVMPVRAGADYYAEIKLTGSGELAVGQVAQLNMRFHKDNYAGNYDQTDDYSYGAGHTVIADWPKITAYVGGVATPVWGTEP